MKKLTEAESTKIGEAVLNCVDQTGINPRNIYCIQTGAPIGRVNRRELLLTIEMLSHLDSEELSDELATRTLISMRPSIAWNVLDSHSMNKLRLRAPRQLLSYLMGRMYEPRERNGNLRINLEQRIENYRSRVHLWTLIESLPIDNERLNRLLVVLLRIDSLFNLNSVAVGSNFPSPATIQNDESADSYLDRMWEWYDALEAHKIRMDRQNKMSREYWTKGNSTARSASLSAALEAKPMSESATKKQEKIKADNQLTNLLRSIMEAAERGEVEESTPIEAPKPSGFIPKGAFKKLNLAGKA